MHIGSHCTLWLKSASYASSHPCMRTCVLFLVCPLPCVCFLYLVSLFSFQPFLMSTSALNERSRSNPLCDFRLGTVVTSDYETPLTGYEPKKDLNLTNAEELDLATTSDICTPWTTMLPSSTIPTSTTTSLRNTLQLWSIAQGNLLR